MYKKRISPESRTDEQTNEDSDSVFQQDDNAKRVKLASFSDTTLQDLPIELLECILVRAVAMEVKGMKLVKSVWKEKADLVISRLSTVCSQWSYIITTDIFRNIVYRILDRTAQETFRLEILHQSPLPSGVTSMTTMKDEIFMLCLQNCQDYFINVYDRNNMAEVKDVIPLPGLRPRGMAACSVSNCVYILSRVRYSPFSISRIVRDEEHRPTVSQGISEMYLRHATISVAANGSLILKSLQNDRLAITVCDANGSNLHEMKLPPDISRFCDIIPKANGNLVLVSGSPTTFLEIDMDGASIHQYKSSLTVYKSIGHVDNYGRLLTVHYPNKMELLDSECNVMDLTGQQLHRGQIIYPFELRYNSERNEIVVIVYDQNFLNPVLTIFHLKEI